MVGESDAKQFEGFDYNDYYLFDTSAWTWDFGAGQIAFVNGIQMYVAGTQANAQVAPPFPPAPPLANIAWAMAQTPQPTPSTVRSSFPNRSSALKSLPPQRKE